MRSSLKKLLKTLIEDSVKRSRVINVRVMGKDRSFLAYDRERDTIVVERGVWTDLDAHSSVLLVEKSDLVKGARGHIITVTTGTHAVAAIPLLNGKFWNLCSIPKEQVSEKMSHCVLCANSVDGKLEISQRDVPCEKLVALDEWLLSIGFGLQDVVLLERNDKTLENYRTLGQEWRVRPLAWTDVEMSAALNSSLKKIASKIVYYHSVKGVHFLSYSEFHRLVERASKNFAEFKSGLSELASELEDEGVSFIRMPKIHGHHEIEFFGLIRGAAEESLIPSLEALYRDMNDGKITKAGVISKMKKMDSLYLSLLARPEYEDEGCLAFREALYMHLTGEIYSIAGDGAVPAFDDRRTALPGATFEDGKPVFHPGTDSRSEVLLSNIRQIMSAGEIIEYANVYELRTDDTSKSTQPLGKGLTREIVFKTNRRPLTESFVEKRLSQSAVDYGCYVIARISGFKSLGVSLAEYRLMRRRDRERPGIFHDYYMRTRCEGEPLVDIPASYFKTRGTDVLAEDPQFVSALAFYMGDAAAQNVVMKKYDKNLRSSFYGIGKEIYRCEFDSRAGRLMPCDVSCCSLRGTMGWQDISYTEENMSDVVRFYTKRFASVLHSYAKEHQSVSLTDITTQFMLGFKCRTRAMAWSLMVRRDEFEHFDPKLPKRYGFIPKWRFVLWALDWQVNNLDAFSKSLENMLNVKLPE